jgi:hypothetical protein
MLVHLPRMAGWGIQPRTKKGPALAGHGAVAMKDALALTIANLPEQLRRSLTWDCGTELAQHAQLKIETGQGPGRRPSVPQPCRVGSGAGRGSALRNGERTHEPGARDLLRQNAAIDDK